MKGGILLTNITTLKAPKVIDRRNDILKHPTKPSPKRLLQDIIGAIVHHSLTKDGSADAFANFHVNTNGWSNMGYTYVIRLNGDIEWCADWNIITPHVGNHNKKYIGICIVGDFRTQKPTATQYNSLYWLLDLLYNKTPQLKLNLLELKGHQELGGYAWKQCPALDMDALRGNFKSKVYNPVANNFNNDTKIEFDLPQITNKAIKDSAKLYWEGTEFANGQIGKITILQTTKLLELTSSGFKTVRELKPNESYRVYGYNPKLTLTGAYNVGGKMYVAAVPGTFKYETPSAAFLQKAKEFYADK